MSEKKTRFQKNPTLVQDECGKPYRLKARDAIGCLRYEGGPR